LQPKTGSPGSKVTMPSVGFDTPPLPKSLGP
jgi:hypothetical protein